MHTLEPTPRYQAYYCEENVLHLLKHPQLIGRAPLQALFISNPRKAIALFSQRAGRSRDGLIFWDYHVVCRAGDQIVDLDCTAGAPLPWRDWFAACLPQLDAVLQPDGQTPRAGMEQWLPFLPEFRCVPATQLLEHFSSDRRHMLDEQGNWRQPPPPWPAPFAPERGFNLMDFIDLQDESVPGEHLSAFALRQRLRQESSADA